jgi:general secretion pathway protein G
MKKENFIKGFTLVELLVVISIIGILIGLSIFGLQSAREASRDARRKADLEQIRSGLEMYRSDCDTYPLTAELNFGEALIGNDPGNTRCDGNTYISQVPTDPIDPSRTYYYLSDGLIYQLCSALEQTPTSPESCTGNCTESCNYRTDNP